MTLVYRLKLSLKVYHTHVKARKIDSSTLKILEMILANLQVEDKLRRAQFFQKTLLLVDINTEIGLDMPFLIFSNTEVQFVEKELTWRSYTTDKALSATKRVKLIDKKEFTKVALDENSKTFVMHIASLNLAPGIHSEKEAQIASLLTKEVKILDNYSDYANVFF